MAEIQFSFMNSHRLTYKAMYLILLSLPSSQFQIHTVTGIFARFKIAGFIPVLHLRQKEFLGKNLDKSWQNFYLGSILFLT